VLVIDDDPVLRALFAAVLTEQGMEVVTAADGARGLQRFRDSTPDLVVTDIVMPETEGLELIMQLRGEHPRLPIVAISGGNLGLGADYLAMARKLGADASLLKPVSPEQIRETAERFLGAEAVPGGEASPGVGES
jgi:CheY-like chemotaxis protein